MCSLFFMGDCCASYQSLLQKLFLWVILCQAFIFIILCKMSMRVHKYLKIPPPPFCVAIKSNTALKVSYKGCHLTLSEIGGANLPSILKKTSGHQKCKLSCLKAAEKVGVFTRDSPKPWRWSHSSSCSPWAGSRKGKTAVQGVYSFSAALWISVFKLLYFLPSVKVCLVHVMCKIL